MTDTTPTVGLGKKIASGITGVSSFFTPIVNSISTAFGQLTTPLKTILIVLVFAFAALSFHDCHQTTSLDTFISHYNSFKKDTVAPILKYNDSITVLVNAHNIAANKAIREALKQKARADSLAKIHISTNVLQGQIDSLKTLIPTIHSDSIIIAKQDTVIAKKDTNINILTLRLQAKTTEADSLWSANTQQRLSIRFLTTSRDSLSNLLKNLPATPSNPDKLFNLIPLPSRSASAIAGTAVGIIGTIILMSHK